MRRSRWAGPSARATRAARAFAAAHVLGVLVLGGAVVLAVLLGVDRAVAQGTEEPGEEDQLRRGAELYQRQCAICHANDGSGVADVAPPIDVFTLPRVDLSMRTGRMPLPDPMRGLRNGELTDDERAAITAYLDELLDLEGELPDAEAGDPRTGREVFAIHCAQCHGASGTGGVSGEGVDNPPVVGLDPVTIAAATREGPFAMPRFGPQLISDDEIDDIVAFLHQEVHAPTSPLGMAQLSKFEAVGFSALLTVVIVLLSMWAGGARSGRQSDIKSEH